MQFNASMFEILPTGWYSLSLHHTQAGVAQLVEQLIRNQQVIGSSPIAGSIVTPSNSKTY
jgi:hypothetical protein